MCFFARGGSPSSRNSTHRRMLLWPWALHEMWHLQELNNLYGHPYIVWQWIIQNDIDYHCEQRYLADFLYQEEIQKSQRYQLRLAIVLSTIQDTILDCQGGRIKQRQKRERTCRAQHLASHPHKCHGSNPSTRRVSISLDRKTRRPQRTIDIPQRGPVV